MGPIVLLAGVLVLLYGVASMFGGRTVASAQRGGTHTRRYAIITIIAGAALIITGLVMIGA